MTSVVAEAEVVRLPRVPQRDPRAVWLVLSVGLMTVAVWQVARAGVWSAAFFFDEMWRVDFIRAEHMRAEMLTHGTPVPYGWLLLMRGLTAWLPYEPFIWRAIVGAFMVLALLLIGVLLLRMGRPEQRLHPMVCAVSAAALLFIGPVRDYVVYFQNYSFETLYTVLLLFATMEMPRSRRALPAFCVLVALAPLFVVGPLFVVPALVVYALRWAWRSEPAKRRSRMGALVIALVVAVADLVGVYVIVYRPMKSTAAWLRDFWVLRGGSLGGDKNVLDLVGSLSVQLRDGLVGPNALDAGGVVLVIATAVVIAGAVVGTVTVWRRWPWLLIAVGSGQLLTIPASAATGWPVNLQRVNLSFQVFLFAVVVLGVIQGVLLLARRFRAPAWTALPAFGLLLTGLWFPNVPASDSTFGRGLYTDLGLVARASAAHNLVIQYHVMGRYTAQDRLINTKTPGHTFQLVFQQPGDDSLYRPLDTLIAGARLRPGDEVWCVMPLEIGPSKFRQACRISDPSLEPLLSSKQSRSTIRAYRVT